MNAHASVKVEGTQVYTYTVWGDEARQCVYCVLWFDVIMMLSCEPAHDCESEECTRMPTDQRVGCPGDEARQCKIVAMY